MGKFKQIRPFLSNVAEKLSAWWRYFKDGVWNETADNWRVNVTKVLSLSVQSFMDKNLQQRACALTYSTVLAVVPALAMLFAIGRGFGFQNILQSE
ncbi:MAG: YihY/virulence factor BrkB family protein, partial [Muribaculaceae bacterium]|nr:YihY/virulence factor BrkB family protein [Muribaculaceae bacterium]